MPTTRPYIRPLVQPKFRREKKGLTPAERGTATHLVLQYLDLQNLDVPGQVAKLRLEAQADGGAGGGCGRTRSASAFCESPLAEEMRQAETAAREYRFTVLMPARDYDPAAAEEDSILLQGVVDCWFETPEGITVVDFKTDFVQTERRCGAARRAVPGPAGGVLSGAGTGAGKGGGHGRHCTSCKPGKPWKSRDFKLFRKNRKKCLQSVYPM